MKSCKKCKEPKTWRGDDVECAFKNGVFDCKNWSCGTMMRLRYLAEKGFEEGLCGYYYYRSDYVAGTIGIIHIPEDMDCSGYLVITWNKNWGETGNAIIVEDDEPPKPLTLDFAEELLAIFKDKLPC